jgi:hypothetical protein
MKQTLMNSEKFMGPESRLTVMIGDSLIKNQHLPITAQLIEAVSNKFTVEKIAVRIPKFTEATWASSQRRKKNELGISMFDFLVTLRKK